MEVVLKKAYLTWQPPDSHPLYTSLIGKQVLVRLKGNPSFIKGVLLGVDHLPNHRETPGAMGKVILQSSKGLIIVRASIILAIGGNR